jgi:hypothetical protein
MQPIILEATHNTPRVVFETNGNLFLQGRSLTPDVITFYQPLIEWATQLNTPTVCFTFELDYLSTASSKKLLQLLQVLENNSHVGEFNVIWKFEEDDEDILVKGQIYGERLKKAKFKFSEYVGT